MTNAIQIEGISKTFKGGIRALQGIDLSVESGCCFGLLGPNGAGKSTLVKVLLSIVKPSTGQAELLGRNINAAEARRGVGYLPEGHRFPNYLRGREVCEYFGRLSGLSGAELKNEVDEKLEIVGMQDWGSQKVSKYSKGMNQRVGLAQAMLGNPDILFLDEPTDGVDPMGRQEIREVINGFADAGRCVFLNSHLLSEVEMMCDKIAVLHKGELLRQGTVQEVKRSFEAGAGKGQVEVAFQTSAATPEVHAWLTQRGAVFQGEEEFTLMLEGAEATDAIIDQLRNNNVSIRAITPQAISLEDAFIAIIHEQDDQSVGGAR